MTRPIRMTPSVDTGTTQEVPGPVGAAAFDLTALRARARAAFASIDNDAEPDKKLAAIGRCLHAVTLAKYHPESGIRLVMALDFTLASIRLPEPIASEAAAEDIGASLSQLASTLHRAVSSALLALTDDISAVLGAGHD